MQQFKEAVGILKKSNEFKEWKKKNPDTYLSYGFFVLEQTNSGWKIGYYHKKDDKITSFNIGKKVNIEPESEIFKKPETKVEKLDEKKVKLDLADAITIANSLQKEEYAGEDPQKIIAILQTLKMGQVWNITFVTKSFNTLNFKIKSENGRVLDKKLTSLFEFRKG